MNAKSSALFYTAVAGATLIALVSLIVLVVRPSEPVPISTGTLISIPPSLPDSSSLADVAEKVMPAVVNIFSNRPAGGRPRSPFAQQSLGSGVLVSPTGYILTNHHVVDRAYDIRVVLADRRDFAAVVVGTDAPSDLAVLRIDARNLPSLPLGDSSKIRIGELVLAVGNPFGVGQAVTLGIISATGRANVGVADYEDFLQTDAAVNPGNSGGALVNMSGQLIGINTAILSRSGGHQGIGFAIPSNMARTILDAIVASGEFRRGFLGVTVLDLTTGLAERAGLVRLQGVYVASVQKESPADRAGLRPEDIILSLDGQPVGTAAELRNRVSLKGPNAVLQIRIFRRGSRIDVTATLDEAPRGERP